MYGGRPLTAAVETPQKDQSPHPSCLSQRGLDWFVFFLADVQMGFGPFVAVYLTAEKWTQADIGLVLTVSGLVALAGQMPGGALVDAARSERWVAALARHRHQHQRNYARHMADLLSRVCCADLARRGELCPGSRDRRNQSWPGWPFGGRGTPRTQRALCLHRCGACCSGNGIIRVFLFEPSSLLCHSRFLYSDAGCSCLHPHR